jgi:hypothetical protein
MVLAGRFQRKLRMCRNNCIRCPRRQRLRQPAGPRRTTPAPSLPLFITIAENQYWFCCGTGLGPPLPSLRLYIYICFTVSVSRRRSSSGNSRTLVNSLSLSASGGGSSCCRIKPPRRSHKRLLTLTRCIHSTSSHASCALTAPLCLVVPKQPPFSNASAAS